MFISDCVITLQGIRALTIDKDNSPKVCFYTLRTEISNLTYILSKLIWLGLVQWNPATLDEVAEEKINLVFEPMEGDIELLIPETEANRSVLYLLG